MGDTIIGTQDIVSGIKIRMANGCHVTGDFLFFRTSEKVLEVNKIMYVPAKRPFFYLKRSYSYSR